MNKLYITDIETTLKIFELAKKHGKKAGDNIQDEFDEIRKQYPDKFQFLGKTDKDKDLLCGDLRENGIRVINPDEEKRRNENKNN